MQSDQILVLDNRISVSDQTATAIFVSGVQISQIDTSNPDGSSFVSSIIFNNITTPSINSTIVSRRVRLKYTLVVSANANPPILDPVAALAAGGAGCALRALPLQSICSNASVILNGSTTNIDLRSTISATQRRIQKDYLKRQASECPSMADNLACLGVDALGTALTSQQVLSGYYNSDGTTRASYQPIAFDNAAHTFTYEVSEPLLISPFSLYENETGLALVNTLSLQLNYQFLNDMFVFGEAAAVPAGFAVTLSNPRLQLEYFQVAADIVKIPSMVSVGYENLVVFNRALTAMAHTNVVQTFTAQSDTLRFSAMPDLIYIFARGGQITSRTSAVGTASQADAFLTFAESPSVQITLGNRSGLLTSASKHSLYEIAVRNGYNSSYADFSLGSGSLFILSPTKDLGLNLAAGDIAVGQNGSVNFQFQANYTNQNYVDATGATGGADITTMVPELVIIPVFSGRATLSPSNCIFSIADLSDSEMRQLLRTADESDGTKVSSETLKPTIQGGSLFGSAKRLLSKVAEGIQSVAGHPIMSALAGMGGDSGGLLTGGKLRRR